jgi:hypothetical protein
MLGMMRRLLAPTFAAAREACRLSDDRGGIGSSPFDPCRKPRLHFFFNPGDRVPGDLNAHGEISFLLQFVNLGFA